MAKWSTIIRVRKHDDWLKSINIRYASIAYKPYVRNTAAYMEAYTQHKLKKWEKKHPKNQQPKELDLFENKPTVPWAMAREIELERIRSFVASVYDKLALIGRYRLGEGKYVETEILHVKRSKVLSNTYKSINDIPANSKILRRLIKTNISGDLVCCILADNKNRIGRIILPTAA